MTALSMWCYLTLPSTNTMRWAELQEIDHKIVRNIINVKYRHMNYNKLLTYHVNFSIYTLVYLLLRMLHVILFLL